MPARAPAFVPVLAALVLAVPAVMAVGCGGDDARPGATTARSGFTPAPSGPLTAAERAQVAVVRHWADTLRSGDSAAAARAFALPARVANGGRPVVLTRRTDALFFNETLPCGAKVVGAERSQHGFLTISFLLTERPGAGACGSGTGNVVQTAIRVRGGHITDWLRLPDPATGPQTEV